MALVKAFLDWHLSTGHAHPDANSFIIFARGQYLTGDTGYAGVPMTEHHNTLLVNGKGQAKEGKGHDVFDGAPYERLDQIRITEVKVEKNRSVVRGDATAADEPELGVTKFVREFEYVPGNGFTVRDEVQTAKPAVLTSLLHADDRIEKEAAERFSIKVAGVKLLVETVEPKGMKTAIEPNGLTAAGPPGAVDKGERQERGQKLLISTGEPTTTARFVMRLKVQA